MAPEIPAQYPRADLQTAQNRMFPFVTEAMQQYAKSLHATRLTDRPEDLQALFETVRRRVFDLLHIPADNRAHWHMGISDSGKRTIELLVNFLCPAEAERNALLDTENYVAFNKFSAATALEKQKAVGFTKPFRVPLGSALTVSDEAFDKCAALLADNRLRTLWVSWNSTSTGVRENMARIVKSRNEARSETLIIADAASLRLFTTDWTGLDSELLPDIFFFSLRKQGLPYDGPNDEFHQARNSGALILCNERALDHARSVQGDSLYDCPSLTALAEGVVTQGEQRANHVRHLLKLDCALAFFSEQDRLAALDADRQAARKRIMTAFSKNGASPLAGFTLLSDPAAQSDSAYILKVPERTNAKKVITGLKEEGILISASMHPKLDGQRHIRFAFYPANSVKEVTLLLDEIGRLA